MHENTNDLTQQIHLLKAANFNIFKTIKRNNDELEELVEATKKLEAQLVTTTQTNITDELEILNQVKARLENKLNERNMARLANEQ